MRTQVGDDYTFLYMGGAQLTQSMSENVKISRAETMSQNFRHIVISTHKDVCLALIWSKQLRLVAEYKPSRLILV